MNAIKDGGLLHAAKGARGDLDGWLESHDEAEVRTAILELADQKTLRDEFAAKAMHAVICEPQWSNSGEYSLLGRLMPELALEPAEQVARCAYILADAMIKAREAQP